MLETKNISDKISNNFCLNITCVSRLSDEETALEVRRGIKKYSRSSVPHGMATCE